MDTLVRIGLGNAVAATVLAILVAALSWPLRNRPAWRHCLWLLVLLKLVTPPLWSVPVAWLPAPDHLSLPDAAWFDLKAAGEARAPLDPHEDRLIFVDRDADASTVRDVELDPLMAESLVRVDETAGVVEAKPSSRLWFRGFIAAWAIGSLFALGLAAFRIGQFQRLLGAAVPASEAAHDQVEEIAGWLGLKCRPSVWWMPGVVSPMIWAVGLRPRVILPEGLWDRLDKRQRVTLLVHELAHLKRRDHWIRVLELLATAVYWWLPVMWWARRALREAEEQCCDAWVVSTFPCEARTYADALLETVEFLSRSAPAAATSASGLGHVRHLKRRLIMIMQARTPRALPWSGSLLASGLALVLLPLAPTWAQVPAEKPQGTVVIERLPDGATVTRHLESAPELEVRPDDIELDVELSDVAYVARSLDEPVADRSEAVNKAIEQLKERLKEAMGDEGSDSKRKKAIDEAIAQLRKALEANRRVAIVRQRLRSDDAEEKLSTQQGSQKEGAEKHAEIEKARAELKALAEQVRSKEKELRDLAQRRREAELRLAKTLGRPGGLPQVQRGWRMEVHDGKAVVVPQSGGPGGTVRTLPPTARVTRVLPQTEYRLFRADPNSNQDRRLADLEKKLSQLQKELAELRKSKD